MNCERVRELAPGFVLEALDAGEMNQIREHLARCSRPHPELRELGGVVHYLGTTVEPVEPPERLKSSILAAAQADLSARQRSDRAAERLVSAFAERPARAGRDAAPAAGSEAAPAPLPLPLEVPAQAPAEEGGAVEPDAAPEPRHAPVIALSSARGNRSRRTLTWLVRIAAALFFVAVGASSVMLGGGFTGSGTATPSAKDIIEAVAVPGTVVGPVKPQGDSKAAGIVVLQPTGHVLVELSGLSQTSGKEVYVLWIAADEQPLVAVATFPGGKAGVAHVEVNNAPTGSRYRVVVSKEPKPGATQPTKVVASGFITG